MVCLLEAPISLVDFLVSGYRIVRNSSDPGKVLIVILVLTYITLYSRAGI